MAKLNSSNQGGSVKTLKPPLMVTIPAGMFYMGTSNDQIEFMLANDEEWALDWDDKDMFTDEQPFHEVTLPDYKIARFPVTNLEYYQFVLKSGYKTPKGWTGFQYPDQTDDYPVVGVSYYDALAYIGWLNRELNENYRFPNEAEWEKAARGVDGRIYPWGNEFDPWRCNTVEAGKRTTTPVGTYSPGGDSIFGVADMAGNVLEWTSSQMMPYPFQVEVQDNSEISRKNSLKLIVRGGAWYYSRKLARTTCREEMLANYLSTSLGFRLCRDS
jgi:formylglycine-generating enzyme required for sulfatase activity